MANILHRVGIKSPPEAVYRALTTHEGLAGWWTHDTHGDGNLGGTLTFRFSADGSEIGFFDMKVLELDPKRRVLWRVVDGPEEWIGTRVRWDLKQDGDWSIVLFQHEDWKAPGEFMHHCSTKWATYLLSLKALVETGAGAPSPDDVRIGDWH